jgi:hypothetical protein
MGLQDPLNAKSVPDNVRLVLPAVCDTNRQNSRHEREPCSPFHRAAALMKPQQLQLRGGPRKGVHSLVGQAAAGKVEHAELGKRLDCLEHRGLLKVAAGAQVEDVPAAVEEGEEKCICQLMPPPARF